MTKRAQRSNGLDCFPFSFSMGSLTNDDVGSKRFLQSEFTVFQNSPVSIFMSSSLSNVVSMS